MIVPKYDRDAIELVLNGAGDMKLRIRDGDFGCKAGQEYEVLVGGEKRTVRADRHGLSFGVTLRGRTEVRIEYCSVGDIWTDDAIPPGHCGIVRQVGSGELLVEHCSSQEGGVVRSWCSSGRCWTGSPAPSMTDQEKQQQPPQPEEAPPETSQSIIERIREVIDGIRSFFGFE